MSHGVSSHSTSHDSHGGPHWTSAKPELHEQLAEAERLAQGKAWDDARRILETLDPHYPRSPEVLTGLINVYYHLGDLRAYQAACQRLLRIDPNNPDLLVALSGAFLANKRPALALRTFRRFLACWPQDERAERIAHAADELELRLHGPLQRLGLAGDDRFELAAMHEEIQDLLESGDRGRFYQVAGELLNRAPGFPPAMSNLAEAHWLDGRPEQAVALLEEVVSQQPEDHCAMANLVRYLVLVGRREDAREQAARLRSILSLRPDVVLCKLQAMSYLGDDATAVQIFEEFMATRPKAAPNHAALIHHFAAAAAMRLHNETDARTLWRRAVRLDANCVLALSNLADLKNPATSRHAPWAFGLVDWVPVKLLNEIEWAADAPAWCGSDPAIVDRVRRCAEAYPHLARCLPLLLERGDPEGRTFAVRLGFVLGTPECLEQLRIFALGKQGPDRLRFETARALCEVGFLPAGVVELWIGGRWQQRLLSALRLHNQSANQHAPDVRQLQSEAVRALQRGQGVEGERLLRRALEAEPDSPDLLNNLAAAYHLQGRAEESRRLVRELHERFPDYLFGRVKLAHFHMESGELDRARELIHPLLYRQKFHHSEFAALCNAQVGLHVAEGKLDFARQWLKFWSEHLPEHPALEGWKGQLVA